MMMMMMIFVNKPPVGDVMKFEQSAFPSNSSIISYLLVSFTVIYGKLDTGYRVAIGWINHCSSAFKNFSYLWRKVGKFWERVEQKFELSKTLLLFMEKGRKF